MFFHLNFRTAPSDFSAVRKYFEDKNITLEEADVLMVANDKIDLNEDQMVSFMKMLDAFDDNDDVQDVYHNVVLPDVPVHQLRCGLWQHRTDRG